MLKKKNPMTCSKGKEAASKKIKKKRMYDNWGTLVSELKLKVQRLEGLLERKGRKTEELRNKNEELEQEAIKMKQLNMRLQENKLTAIDEGKGREFRFL